jgi:hypothetical protein
MDWTPRSVFLWLFDWGRGAPGHLISRWLFLRALGLIYFSAFFSLIFQIHGLIGTEGILPADRYLQAVEHSLGPWQRVWYAPTLLWWSSSSTMLNALCWAGMLASVLLILNLWPRVMLGMSFVCFLSFIAAAQEFSSYQSDGMLLEAGFISLFFAPPGLRPGLGWKYPPSRASLFLLRWEWFRIYFESGAVKLLSGEPQWRNFTAMDEYYQNGPLPTWVGWYAQHLPHRFHAATAFATLTLELGIVWMLFLPRRFRIACFFIVTIWQIPVILTANYCFLNYLVLVLGVLLLDDRFIVSILPAKWKQRISAATTPRDEAPAPAPQGGRVRRYGHAFGLFFSAVMLSWIFYSTTAQMIWMFVRAPLPASPVAVLEPFRIANQYGLFAVMTRGRYEIEFQGSSDGTNWVAYPFRYKPQDPLQPPRIYAPYQPRFDWNLWFASLGAWRDYPFVPNTEIRLLSNDKDVLTLFTGNPFAHEPPRRVRAVLWQYWFTTMAEKRSTGVWWRRQMLGLYAPVLERGPDGSIQVIEWPAIRSRE